MATRLGRMAETTPVKRSADRKPALWKIAFLFTVLVGALVLAHAAITLGTFSYYRALDLIVPGVQLGGIAFGGKTEAQAAAELDRVWNLNREIIVVDNRDVSRNWIVAPAEFGLAVDAGESAANAFGVGRGRGFWAGLDEALRSLDRGRSLDPVVTFDSGRAMEAFSRWAERVYEPAVEASIHVEGGQVIHTPGRAGYRLDVQSSLELLAADPKAVMLEYGFIPLLMMPEDPTIRDYEELAAKAEALLNAPPTLEAYDPVTDESFQWRPSREELATWLELHTESEGSALEFADVGIEAFVENLDQDLGQERTFDHTSASKALLAALEGGAGEVLRIRYRSRSHVVRSQDSLVSIGFKTGLPYWQILEANPAIARRGLVRGEMIEIPPRDAMLELPVVPEKRIVISISEQRMWVYHQGNLQWDFIVSSGIPSSPTLPGIFQIQSHEINAYASIWDLYMPHFMGIYKATPDLMNGIHGLPLLSSGARLWADVLGQPASFGCIILDLQAAAQLYDWAEEGVVVEIRR